MHIATRRQEESEWSLSYLSALWLLFIWFGVLRQILRGLTKASSLLARQTAVATPAELVDYSLIMDLTFRVLRWGTRLS